MSVKRTAVNLSPSFIKTMVFECTGTNDLILTSMTNKVTNLKRGLILIFEMSETNTGTVTAKVSDVPTPASLVGADGRPLSPGELKKGNIYQFFYTGTVFKMIYSDVILEEGEGMRIEKKPDGTFVIGTTIVDTWRPVTDSLDSDSSSTSLSAKAGKTLKKEVDDRYTKKEAYDKFVERSNGRVLIGTQNLDFSMKAPVGYSAPRAGGYSGGDNPHGNVNITEDGLDIKSNYSVNVVINKDDGGEAFYRLYTGSGRKRLLEIGENAFTYGPQNYKVYHEGHEPSWNKLKDKPDLAAKVHNHDDRYYTETEMDSKLGTKLDKNAKAVDSGKLEGKTKAQVVIEARVGLATKAQLDTAVAESAYGIKYSVANEAERLALKGMIATEQCVQKDNRIVYRWSGHTWDQFYTLDGVHNHNDSYYTKSEMNTKLDGKVNNDRVLTNVPRGALFTDTVYKHPTAHPATMITESSTKRFVTDAEKSTWNAKSPAHSHPYRGNTWMPTYTEVGALGKSEKAVDSAKLEGKTKAQVVAEARSGLAATTYAYSKAESDGRFLGKTAKSVDSAKLEGKTKAQVVAEARSGLAGTTYAYSKAESDSRFLGKAAKAADSNKLGGIGVGSFLRGDATDTFTTLSGTTLTAVNLVVGTSNKLRFCNDDYIRYDDKTNTYYFDADGGSGNALIKTGKVYNAVYNDYAELFETPTKCKGMKFEPGDIVMIDLDSDSDKDTYVICNEENSVLAIGVVSDEFAQLIGGRDTDEGKDFEKENEKDHAPIGLMGRVRPKITGPITKGDFIVSSHIHGVGRKYLEGQDNPLSIIGVAVRTKSSPGIERVRMLIKR